MEGFEAASQFLDEHVKKLSDRPEDLLKQVLDGHSCVADGHCCVTDDHCCVTDGHCCVTDGHCCVTDGQCCVANAIVLDAVCPVPMASAVWLML